MKAAANIVITGLVQGVGFRYFVLRHAGRLGLKGFVRNLYDGNVEIEAEADREALEDLLRELRRGPRSANVTDVKVTWREPQDLFTGFHIR